MNAYWYSIQWGFKPRLNKVKPRRMPQIFRGNLSSLSSIKSGHKYAKAHLIKGYLPGSVIGQGQKDEEHTCKIRILLPSCRDSFLIYESIWSNRRNEYVQNNDEWKNPSCTSD
ncbi:hypothetical protein [Siminovitchia terrae]|uniref:hypothetical protein n=1 Tax=Siminovitchia terrae TaxID=1914933 RepID=UPI001BB4465D|nr:hypothetical protein [Siminovitchia terrae]